MIAYGFDAVEAEGKLDVQSDAARSGCGDSTRGTALTRRARAASRRSARRRPRRSGGSGSAIPMRRRPMTTAWRRRLSRRRGGCGHGSRPAAGADPVRGAGHRRAAAGRGPGGARQPQLQLPPVGAELGAGEMCRGPMDPHGASTGFWTGARATCRRCGSSPARRSRATSRSARRAHVLPAASSRFSHLHGPAASDRGGTAPRAACRGGGDAMAGRVAVYKAPGPDGFTLNRLVDRGAVAGTLLTPLARRAGVFGIAARRSGADRLGRCCRRRRRRRC
jgi:hypothetical protein